MRGSVRWLVPMLVLLCTLPFRAYAHDHDSSCDKQNIDKSKLSSEELAALREKCTEQLRAEDCGIGGIDLSMMSTDDQKAMKEACFAKMKKIGCDMKGVDMSKVSVTDTQKMMDQCHDKLVSDAHAPAKATNKPGATTAPAPKAG